MLNILVKVAILSVLLLFASPALAYLDPGTGSIILQGIIASILVGLASIKLWWYRLKNFFMTMLGRHSESSNIETEQTRQNKSDE